MNITKSSTIDTLASVWIDGATFQMNGVFATVFRTFVLQSDDIILQHIFDRNFTNFELDGNLLSPTLIQGYVVFLLDNGKVTCEAELRRYAGTFFETLSVLGESVGFFSSP